MRAAVFHRYGPPDVVRIAEVPDPTPRSGEILIRIEATTVTSADARLRACRVESFLFRIIARLVFGILRPRKHILGTELAGVVQSVGAGVTSFAEGDPVIAFVGSRLGAHAEHIAVPPHAAVIRKPDALTNEEAVAIPFGATTALYYLRDLANIAAGQRVLIIGASGCVGVYAVQLARFFGAHVTAVCSGRNADLVRSLGAERIIDYTTTDYTKGPETYDIVFDTVGAATFSVCQHILAPRGQFLAAVLTASELWHMARTARSKGKRLRGGVTPERREDLEYLYALVESGSLKPVIGHRFPFTDIVTAHQLVDSGRKVGACILTL